MTKIFINVVVAIMLFVRRIWVYHRVALFITSALAIIAYVMHRTGTSLDIVRAGKVLLHIAV